MTKKEARAYVKEVRAKLGEEDFCRSSETVFEKLKTIKAFEDADTVLIYVSYNNEVDTYPIIKYCMLKGKNVFVPKVYGDEMKFHLITDINQLAVGKFGIMEPINDYNNQWDDISGVMVMPGVAFDCQLNRVGYGGGFYDKYLSRHKDMLKIAICFDFQLLSGIEAEEHDLKPDIIVCENTILSSLGET